MKANGAKPCANKRQNKSDQNIGKKEGEEKKKKKKGCPHKEEKNSILRVRRKKKRKSEECAMFRNSVQLLRTDGHHDQGVNGSKSIGKESFRLDPIKKREARREKEEQGQKKKCNFKHRNKAEQSLMC